MATQLQLAEAQFIGFHHAKRGYSVKDLALSMGLKRVEWLRLRDTLGLSNDEKQEVDEIFKGKRI